MKRLAAALEAAKSTRSRLAKEKAIGDVLAEIAREGHDERALMVAARIAAGRALPAWGGRKLGVGWRLVYDAVVAQVGDAGAGTSAAMQATGDLGDALELMLGGIVGAAARPGVSLEQIGEPIPPALRRTALGPKKAPKAKPGKAR